MVLWQISWVRIDPAISLARESGASTIRAACDANRPESLTSDLGRTDHRSDTAHILMNSLITVSDQFDAPRISRTTTRSVARALKDSAKEAISAGQSGILLARPAIRGSSGEAIEQQDQS
ncbi:hypothetical protein [Saccharopolyspora sp. 5N708]|uniref:hypothetical protein n=1 Tax=Saccharopolyspora sp. 5N708 TaxID=3457424 RepID=UPI003FD3907F